MAMAIPPAKDRLLPVTVIGGYLGAGKTTLLNRLLAEPQGAPLAVIVNDFGSVNIDAALIANRDGETISLTNGCVCCSIADNLALTLHELAERSLDIEHILIEASGVADPRKIATYAASHPRLVLNAALVVADVETIRARAADKYVGDVVRQQLNAADVIFLNKTDLVDAATLRQVREWIEEEVPHAAVLNTPGPTLFAWLVLSGAIAPIPPPQAHDHCRGHELNGDQRDGHRHGDLFATRTFTWERPLDGVRLRQALASLPPEIVRAKGIVRLAEEPGERYVLQVVGRRWSLEKESRNEVTLMRNSSVIVCIGVAPLPDTANLAQIG